MLTEKDYCDYETCVALIEMGFVGTSRYYYDKKNHKLHITNYGITYTVRTASASEYVLAIHLYDAQKWLREEKFLLIVVDRLLNGEYVFSVVDILNYSEEKNGTTNSYEEALAEGIKEAVKLLTNNKNE